MPSISFHSLSELAKLRINPDTEEEFYLGTHVHMLFRSVFKSSAESFLSEVPQVVVNSGEKMDLVSIYPALSNYIRFCNFYYSAPAVDRLFKECMEDPTLIRRQNKTKSEPVTKSPSSNP